MTTMDPRDRAALEELMMRYVLDELGEEERRDFERRLADDRELDAEVQSLKQTLDLIPYSAAVDPPPHLRARVLEAARRTATGAARPGGLETEPFSATSAAAPTLDVAARGDTRREGTRGPTVRGTRPASSERGAPTRAPRLLWTAVGGAVAAGLVVALGISNYNLRQELILLRDVTTTLQQPNVVLSFALHGTGASRAYGSVVLDLDAKKGAVAIHGLPTAPSDEVYRLWARVGTNTVLCGQFNADPEGTVRSLLPIPVDAYTAPVAQLFVTREPLLASGSPSGATVMVSS